MAIISHPGPERIGAAAVQLAPILGEPDANRARATAAAREAGAGGAQLVVLPELCVSGYAFADADEARAGAEPLEGPSVRQWSALAAELGLVVVAGICELGPAGTLHNTAVVIDERGLRAVHRKSHLWDREQEIFTRGDRRAPVVETRAGRIGVAICYDSFFPEVMRGLALAGAEVIAVPMNSPLSGPPHRPHQIEVTLAAAAATVNRTFVVQADRSGSERGLEWAQASVIVDPDGCLLAGPIAGSGIISAALAVERARDKALGPRNDAFGDRRPELYRRPPARVRLPSLPTPTKETVP